MKRNVMLYPLLFALSVGFASSCTCDHEPESVHPFKVGWVVCTDGQVISFCDYVKSSLQAIAVVYNVNPDPSDPVAGHAVYLNDTPAVAFSDSIPVSQGTSCSLTALDGNSNTYALRSASGVSSPIADAAFSMWRYGQSAYIPSVAQLRQLLSEKSFINPRIEAIGGDPLPDAADECWYWSSTEVQDQADSKSWLFSLRSGAIQETPKDQPHKTRAVITLYR